MTSEVMIPLISRSSPVLPGEEVDVAVEMVAPTEIGRYLGYWRLGGPHGRRKFGQRVWCHVQVGDPAAAVTVSDYDSALAEIAKKQSDVPDDDDETDADAATAAAPAAKPSDASPTTSGLTATAVGLSAAATAAAPSSTAVDEADNKSEDGVLVTEAMAVEDVLPAAP